MKTTIETNTTPPLPSPGDFYYNSATNVLGVVTFIKGLYNLVYLFGKDTHLGKTGFNDNHGSADDFYAALERSGYEYFRGKVTFEQ